MGTWNPTLHLWCAIESRLRSERGQGTVEYVGLVAAVAILLVAISKTLGGNNGIDDKVVDALREAIETV